MKELFKSFFWRIHFTIIKLMKHPYFGPLFRANQVWPSRYPFMYDLIDRELASSSEISYKILEIGSWAGSSAVLWASACKKRNKGIVFCIDTWQGPTNLSIEAYKKTLEFFPGDKKISAALKTAQEMKWAIKNNRIFNLFLHNIEASGFKDYIVLLKGSSDIMTEILKLESSDFVYIDGDHAYTQFKKDLLNYGKVVKVNGIICGDDFELDLDVVDVVNAKNHCEEDYIFDPKTKTYFHPGISLGIKEVFGNVSVKNGFWAMRKTQGGWVAVTLD